MGPPYTVISNVTLVGTIVFLDNRLKAYLLLLLDWLLSRLWKNIVLTNDFINDRVRCLKYSFN